MSLAYRPKKYLGQHFLRDQRAQQKIIQACGFKKDDVVVEIGPGQGAMTQFIAPEVKKLFCVEADKELIEPLRAGFPTAEIIHADFLKWDMPNLSQGLKIIGNIPYYISTPIIEKLLENHARIAEAFLTVQLEFGQRLVAQAGGKDYGSLSCFVQYHADIKMLFKIKNACFKPIPKVDSCLVHLVMKTELAEGQVFRKFLFGLIQKAFQQRRKTIVNSLKGFVIQEKLEGAVKALDLDPKARAEVLTLSNYIELCKKLMI